MIPRILHYIWFGNNPLTSLAEECLASWKSAMPKWQIMRRDESNFDIDAAQRMAHEIERDPVRREEWVVRYTLYRASLPAEARYYHFYNFVYVTLYRMLKEDDLSSR